MTTERESLFAELRRLSPKVTGGLLRMRQETYRDAAVAAKYKLLTAMVVSIAIRCEPCIRAYVRLSWGRVGVKSLRGLQRMRERAATCRYCVLRSLNEPVSNDGSYLNVKWDATVLTVTRAEAAPSARAYNA